jgi:hypothetical protein
MRERGNVTKREREREGEGEREMENALSPSLAALCWLALLPT